MGLKVYVSGLSGNKEVSEHSDHFREFSRNSSTQNKLNFYQAANSVVISSEPFLDENHSSPIDNGTD